MKDILKRPGQSKTTAAAKKLESIDKKTHNEFTELIQTIIEDSFLKLEEFPELKNR